MPRFCANISWLFTELPFLERFAAAAAAGFRAVELRFPYDHDPGEIRAALDAAGLELVLYNTPAGDWDAGERGMAAVPGRGPEFREGFALALDYAEILGPARIHVMAGRAAGRGAQAAFVDNLGWAAEEAPNRHLTIEPINARDVPAYFLRRTDQALGILRAIAAPNLSLQFDIYNVQVTEGDLTRRLEKLIDVIGHVQVAGVPERGEPDRGELDFDHLMGVLDNIGYTGWVGAEYTPAGETREGLGWFSGRGG